MFTSSRLSFYYIIPFSSFILPFCPVCNSSCAQAAAGIWPLCWQALSRGHANASAEEFLFN